MRVITTPQVRAAMTPEDLFYFDIAEDPSIPGRLVLTKSGGLFTGWLTLPGREAIRVRYSKLSDVLVALAREVAA